MWQHDLTLCLHARAGVHAQLVCATDHLSALSTCRLAQLKRKWPFHPRPDHMASAVKHARRGAGTQDELLRSGAAVSDGAKAEANPVLADLAPEAAPTAVPAPPPASAAAPAAQLPLSAPTAAAVDGRDADSTHAIQRPQQRIRRTPTGACRFWCHPRPSDAMQQCGLPLPLPCSNACVSSDLESVAADRTREEMGLPPRALSQPAGTWNCINVRRAPADADSQPAASPGRHVAGVKQIASRGFYQHGLVCRRLASYDCSLMLHPAPQVGAMCTCQLSGGARLHGMRCRPLGRGRRAAGRPRVCHPAGAFWSKSNSLHARRLGLIRVLFGSPTCRKVFGILPNTLDNQALSFMVCCRRRTWTQSHSAGWCSGWGRRAAARPAPACSLAGRTSSARSTASSASVRASQAS